MFWVKLNDSQAAYFDPGVVMQLIVVLPIDHHCGQGICSLSSYASLEKKAAYYAKNELLVKCSQWREEPAADL